MNTSWARFGLPILWFLMSMWDGIVTYIAVRSSDAAEINPFMSYCLHQGPWCFGLTKGLLSLLGVVLLIRLWEKPAAKYLCFFTLGMYTTISITHLAYMRAVWF